MSKRKHPTVRQRARDELIPYFRLDDFALHREIVAAEVEKAYRRGFYQGAAAVVDSPEASLRELRIWQQILFDWRQATEKWIRGEPVMAMHPPPIPIGIEDDRYANDEPQPRFQAAQEHGDAANAADATRRATEEAGRAAHRRNED